MAGLLNENDRIFIAGHTGMVGSAVGRALINHNYKNFLTPSRNDLNLIDTYAVENWFKNNKPDIVILAAAKVGGINANNTYPTDFILDNLKIQINVIENAWKHGTRRLLFLGSSCIYPKYSKQPITEDQLLSGPLESTNQWYAIAKISGLKLCNALRIQHDFDAISLMPTNLYGPKDNYHPSNSHVLPALIHRFYQAKQKNLATLTCWGSGSPLREFMHVDDLGEACVFSLESWDPKASKAPCDKNGDPLLFLNAGTGVDISIKDLTKLIMEATGYEGNIEWDKNKPDGTIRKLLDTSKIQELGWKPKIKLADGINSTIENYKEELKSNKLRLN